VPKQHVAAVEILVFEPAEPAGGEVGTVCAGEILEDINGDGGIARPRNRLR